MFLKPPSVFTISSIVTHPLRNCIRHKVHLIKSHPIEYFRAVSGGDGGDLPTVFHPPPVSNNSPHYFKITLERSLIGLPWQKRYWAGVLFRKYSPLMQYRPKSVRPKISTRDVVFREATPDIAKMIFSLKEILSIENIWSEKQYREECRSLLGKKALLPNELQDRRGFFYAKNIRKSML